MNALFFKINVYIYIIIIFYLLIGLNKNGVLYLYTVIYFSATGSVTSIIISEA